MQSFLLLKKKEKELLFKYLLQKNMLRVATVNY